ncbi:MAG: RHS repeat-associated core domain-containing protein, partial [bacterium]|nr:RHS repeat-associated core domain-containing protein [bacterium]
NGLYDLVLTARDALGQTASEKISVVVEGQMKIGHFTLSFIDLAVPVSGLDIEIIRTYDSRDEQLRDFGVGWSLDIRQGSYVNNRAPGDGWQFLGNFVACDTALESKSHLTVVRLSDQEVYRFALRLYGGAPSTGGGCRASARFDFIDGPLPGTTLEILGNDQVFWQPGSDRVIDVDTFAPFEPEDVRLTTRDGRIFELDLNHGVTKLEDLNGNQLTITPAGITHSSGKGIVFERDAEGRISAITDPTNRVMSYGYDAAGDLVSFTDRAGTVTRFVYNDHRLRDIEDPRGVRSIRNEYDAEGRLVRHIDAFGQVIELGHDRSNRREVITNRLGGAQILEYDAHGNVVRETDELGKVTTRTFDGSDNVLTETDPLGRRTTYTYTPDNDLETVTNPLNEVTAFTYDSRGRLQTVTSPGIGGTTHLYDGANLASTTDALGKVTTFTYDTDGNLRTTTDALGHVIEFEYDDHGNLIRVIDALGHATDSTYDAAGNRLTERRTRTLPDGTTETLLTTFTYDELDRLTSTTAADGSTTSTAYDLLGKVLLQSDPLGRSTTFTYDLMGRLVSTSYADGFSESRSYDAEGRLLTEVDRAGRTISFTYDAVGRLATTTYPDGATTSNTYDDAGQLIATTDARGNTTTFIYDDAGRRTAIVDPYGYGLSFTYDGSGNQQSVTDARGYTTTFTYDALNRQRISTYPGGTTTEVAYDDLGRRIAETDPAGFTTAFGYDALGRLQTVTDVLDQVTSYTWDEVGNRLTQTDANGHTTRFEYDRLGRQIARVLPDDSRESMIHNADGTLASHTDFNGATRTFEYDASRRLTRRAYPDGSEVTFTYTPTGQRATVADARGTGTYTYDDRDRLLEKTDPTGYKLGYGYDLQGNRTRLTATVGAQVFTTTYTYDVLNRLETVTDSQGGVTTLGYDDNGNRETLAHPNGVTTTYTYNALNRLINLSTESLTEGILASYAYTLGPAGNRIRIDEHDGTSRRYLYDALYRLTQDRVADSEGTVVYRHDFTYDSVGNRLEQASGEGGGPTIASTYDTRNRLLTVDETNYSWDTNGNLTGRSVTDYQWDFENRLTSVTLGDGSVVETAYDADGNRVRTVVTAPGGESVTSDFLVDTAGFLSHVVADVATGSVETLYTRANDQLIGLLRPSSSAQRYYHADGLGSVRMLTAEVGNITDRYAYTAFGELLEQGGGDNQPYRFTGEPFDPRVGLAWHRARWVDLDVGRFIGADPFGGFLQEPASLHRYLYAGSNPVDFIDPSGLVTNISNVAIVSAVASLLFTSVSWGLRRAGSTGLANRAEGLSRIANGIAFLALAPYVSALSGPAGGVFFYGAVTAGVDEMLVGVQQLLWGGRPPSPLKRFLVSAGLSPRFASTSLGLLKFLFSMGPNVFSAGAKFLATVRGLGAALKNSGPRGVLASVIRSAVEEIGKVTVRDRYWIGHLENMDAYQKGLWVMRNFWNPFIYHPSVFVLGAGKTSQTGPTVASGAAFDLIRGFNQMFLAAQDQ